MQKLSALDQSLITFCRAHYGLFARIALAIIYFYFGLLKLVGASPADDLAIGFATHMGMGAHAQSLFITLAVVECLIGLLVLVPRLTRLALSLMAGHLLLVCAPLVLYPAATWASPFVPSLAGQYIIKNAALVVVAMGLIARLTPVNGAKA